MASGESGLRLPALVVALAVSLVFGYVRFARRRAEANPVAAPPTRAGAEPPADLPDLTRRVEQLERRLDAAAAFLGGRPSAEAAPEMRT